MNAIRTIVWDGVSGVRLPDGTWMVVLDDNLVYPARVIKNLHPARAIKNQHPASALVEVTGESLADCGWSHITSRDFWRDRFVKVVRTVPVHHLPVLACHWDEDVRNAALGRLAGL